MSNKNEQTNKKERFAFLGKTTKVSSPKTRLRFLGFGGGLVLVLIVVFFFLGHHTRVVAPTQTASGFTDNSITEQNEARLEKLRLESHRPVQHLPTQAPVAAPTESKAMAFRRNAGTSMYSAKPPASVGQDSGSGSAKSKVLVGQGAFSTFANSQSTSATTVTATKIAHPYYTVAEGEFIQATLETAINSEVPGMVRAVITEPVYAYSGQKALLPAGSRLIGQYASMSSNGASTERVFIIWNRVITPSGISLMINSPGTDSLGRGGMGADSIDTHFFRIFGTASLLSVMGAVTATNNVGAYEQPNSANLYRQSIATAFQQSAQSSLNQNLNIKPTLYIHQGNSINVFVAHDLDLYPALGHGA